MGRKRLRERSAARGARHSDERLVALFLDMLAAERGAGKNTLAAYGRDLADFTRLPRRAGRAVATATTDDLRAYLGDLARRGMQPATVARRLSAIRQLYRFLYAEGQRKDDPAAVLEGPKRARALPKTLTLAEVDRLLRAAGQSDPEAPLPRAAARGAACLSGRASLRHRSARLRTRGAARVRRAPRRPRDRGARQGQQGAAGAAQRRRQARDGGISGAARRPQRRQARPDRNGCFPPSATAAISPASISRASSRRSRPQPGCAPRN